MPAAVSILLLCVSPIVLTGAIGFALNMVAGFRKGFGAHTALPTSAILVTAGALVLHAGYFLSPVLLYADHVAIALWLVTPIAVLASLALLWHLMFSSMAFDSNASERFQRKCLIIAGLLVTYMLPVIVLSGNLK